MVFHKAWQAGIIRANQKDEFYQGFIKGSLADIVQSILGARSWIKWRRELDMVGDLGYLALTTLAGYQTLGEEYVNIVQVDSSLRAVPTVVVRWAMISLQVVLPYVIDRALRALEQHLHQNTLGQLPPEATARLLQLIPAARHVITLLQRCHLAAFYMRGVYYHLAKRFTGIHYLLVRRSVSSDCGSGYHLLAWLSISQLVLSFLQQLYHSYHRRRVQKSSKDMSDNSETYSISRSAKEEQFPVDPSSRCSLCLEARKNSTATPCGHIFCWDCILEWCTNKPECPLCREKFELSRLIYLQNYDVT